MHSRALMHASYPLTEIDSENYPELWPEFLNHPQELRPTRLLAQGKPDALKLLHYLPHRGLAIVGTRRPQGRSLSHMRQIVLKLADSGLIIVSGFAIGVDAAAHVAALDAGIPTIGILGNGLHHSYPEENHELRMRILGSGGLLLSEYSPAEAPQADHFLNRNRLIAAWSSAVWIVEASYRSGALNTARWAREFNRPCFTTPCFPGDVTLAGNQILLDRDHAAPLWDAHTFGQVWLPLAAIKTQSQKKSKGRLRRPPQKSARIEMTPPLPFSNLTFVPPMEPSLLLSASDEHLLTRYVGTLTFSRGGAEVHELLEWTLAQGWTPGRYYLALQKALNSGLLTDSNGLLLKNSVK